MKKFFYYIFIIFFAIGITFPCACSSKKSSGEIEPKIIVSEFIYENAPFPQCHASTIVETGDGLLTAWFGGTKEKNPDVCIYTSERKDEKWSTPVLVADGIINDTLRYPCWNPVLFKRDNGDIILYYKVGPSPREWWGLYKISKDNGKTWSDEIPIPDNLLGPIKNKPERLADGTILYPTSYETNEYWTIYTETSDQNLNNWKKTEIDNNGFNAIQPAILFHKDGKIQMLCRSKEKSIVETWSDDNGKTWLSVQATSLPNNNSGFDAVTLNSGKHLLICNPVEKGRNKLSLLLSDDGKKWEDILVLEDQPEGEFSYPAIIQGTDGTIHITYTYNRKTVKYVQLVFI
ncbi:sialidase [Mariniphaga sediminis]|uniref:Sialidase n=1 Tax=Mariniphaga sediminis TaxID=1628158 RepID=A0A399D1V9_9BACT|nr:sialidase family protein [Mariniphaga sediminis]RIH65456.1 sialidase [Mariniphaga sediminis]